MSECACGCGGLTKGIWRRGHDVRAMHRGARTQQTAGWPSIETVDARGCRTLVVRCPDSTLTWSEQHDCRGQWLGRAECIDGIVVSGCQLTATAELAEATSEWVAFMSAKPTIAKLREAAEAKMVAEAFVEPIPPEVLM